MRDNTVFETWLCNGTSKFSIPENAANVREWAMPGDERPPLQAGQTGEPTFVLLYTLINNLRTQARDTGGHSGTWMTPA